MKCPKCQANVPDMFAFCTQCGCRVKDQNGQAVVPQPEGAGEQSAGVYIPPKRALGAADFVLIGLVAANLVGGVLIFNGTRNKDTKPQDNRVAEVSEIVTTAPAATEPEPTVPETEITETEKPAETTAKKTTEKPAETTVKTTKTTAKTTEKTTEKTTAKTTKTTENTTKKTTEKTTKKTTKKTEKSTAAKTTKTEAKTEAKQQVQPEPQPQQSTSASDYYASLGPMPFVVGNSGDPFLLPGMWTRASNSDGQAMLYDAARSAMDNLPVYWSGFDIPCGTEADNNGTSNSTYRYIADAFPVPGYDDLQMPAAIDLYIHNGQAAHGSHLRAIDYRFGNHADYDGPYIWTQGEIESILNGIVGYAEALYGAPETSFDNNRVRYNFRDGALSMGYYERGGKYTLWISRSND